MKDIARKDMKEVQKPFVCHVAPRTFMIRFYADREVHALTNKDDSSENWSTEEPLGTSTKQ